MRYVIRERFFAIGDDSDINDENGRAVYHIDGKILTLRDKLVMHDMEGVEVATIQRKLLAIRPTYHVIRSGEGTTEIRKHLISPFVDRFTIDVPGPNDMQMKGNLLDHEYEITRDGDTVATVSKRWFTLTHTYGVDIAEGEDDVLILATVLALDLAEHREDAATTD